MYCDVKEQHYTIGEERRMARWCRETRKDSHGYTKGKGERDYIEIAVVATKQVEFEEHGALFLSSG